MFYPSLIFVMNNCDNVKTNGFFARIPTYIVIGNPNDVLTLLVIYGFFRLHNGITRSGFDFNNSQFTMI